MIKPAREEVSLQVEIQHKKKVAGEWTTTARNQNPEGSQQLCEAHHLQGRREARRIPIQVCIQTGRPLRSLTLAYIHHTCGSLYTCVYMRSMALRSVPGRPVSRSVGACPQVAVPSEAPHAPAKATGAR